MNKPTLLRSLCFAAVVAFTASLGGTVRADDTDVFFPSGSAISGHRNVLIILDNTSNWARQSQQWPGGLQQGQAEVRAIKTAISQLDSSTSVGLLEFVTGGSANDTGGYVRYDMKPMTTANQATLGTVLDTIFNNINGTTEKRNSGTQYGDLMYDAYNYLAGATTPTRSTAVDSNLADANAYTTRYSQFKSPLSGVNGNCGPTSIIFIGNPNQSGPTRDTSANTAALSGLHGNVTQLPLPGVMYATTGGTNPDGTPIYSESAVIGTTSSCFSSTSACSSAVATQFPSQCASSSDCACTATNATSQLGSCASGQRYTVSGTTNNNGVVSDNNPGVATQNANTGTYTSCSNSVPTGAQACPAQTSSTTTSGNQTTTVYTSWASCTASASGSITTGCNGQKSKYPILGTRTVRTVVTSTSATQTLTNLGNTFACYSSSASCLTSDYNTQCATYNGGCACTGPTSPNFNPPAVNGTCPNGGQRYQVLSTATQITATQTGTSTTDTNPYNFDEWARFLQLIGVNGTKVRTYTIDVFNKQPDSVQTSLFISAAKVGGGKYFSATNEAQIVNSLNDIFDEVLDIDTTFVAPAVTVNTFNRLTNRDELYFALFRPAAQVKWEGNLKKYKLGQISGVTRIVDANGADAVDNTTGFFKSSAQSVWSSLVDGTAVDLGGLVGRLTNSRNMYTYTGADKPPAASVTPVNLTTELLAASNTNITNTMVGLAATAPPSDLTNLLNWAHGIDVDDINKDGSTTDARQSIGDPLHSRPSIITYKGTNANPDLTIFFADNEGTFHAVAGDTGDEIFSYTPKELLGHLSSYRSNVGDYRNRPYGFDGPITRLFRDLNNDLLVLNTDGTTQTGEFVYLYGGMRRGGRNYYSLDVTNRSAPKLRWVIYGGSGSYAELGQTWSDAVVSKIKFNGVTKDVIIFTGGYDPAEDTKDTLSGDSQGRAVYIADALTGERLWWASSIAGANVTLSTMNYSIPAAPKVVDLDADGLADRMYVADAGGQIFRFEFNESNTGSADFATGSRIAMLSDADTAAASRTAANARRFFASPDVALIDQGSGQRFLSIAIGSGHRERPNNTAIQDRFYVLRDPNTAKGSAGVLSITESDLYNATSNIIGQGTSTEIATATSALNASKGFYITLSKNVSGVETFIGEKVFTESLTVANNVIFASFTPDISVSNCAIVPGQSKLYLLSVINGMPVVDYSSGSNPAKCTDTACDRADRSVVLAQQGLPADPALIFPSIGGAIVCIGSECSPAQFANSVNKVYWLKKSE